MQMWPLALPWASRGTPRSDTDVSAGPGPASEGPGAGPSLISPARQDAKLEDLEGLSRRAATHRPSTMTVPADSGCPEVPKCASCRLGPVSESRADPGAGIPRPAGKADKEPPMAPRWATTATPPAGMRGPASRAGTSRQALTAEAAVPRGVRAQRAEEVDPAERGPVGVAEVELGLGALPQQESAQALLSRGPDDQVRIGLAGRVQVLGDVLDIEDAGQLLDRGALGRVGLQQGPDRVRDLPPAAVADGHVDQQAAAAGRDLAGVLERTGGLRGQQVQGPDRVDSPAAVDELAHGFLDDPQQRLELAGRAAQVVGRQQPQGDHLDAVLLAPLQQLEDLVGALLVPPADVGHSRRPGPAPVAVAHHANVVRDRSRRQTPLEPPLIEPVHELAQSHPASPLPPAATRGGQDQQDLPQQHKVMQLPQRVSKGTGGVAHAAPPAPYGAGGASAARVAVACLSGWT